MLPANAENGLTCPDCAGTRGYVENCITCKHTGYVHSYTNSFGDTISICSECSGKGCDTCHGTGAIVTSHNVIFDLNKHRKVWADLPIVPMPYGKILPDLTNCHYIDNLCPACGSDHVVILDKEHNPYMAEEQEILAERFFCISCQDSWCYERER